MEEDGIQLPIIAVNLVTVNVPYSSNKLDNIHEETRKDPTIKVCGITLAQDGPVNEGCFHKSYIHIGTFGMSYLVEDDLLQRVPNFSYLPA